MKKLVLLFIGSAAVGTAALCLTQSPQPGVTTRRADAGHGPVVSQMRNERGASPASGPKGEDGRRPPASVAPSEDRVGRLLRDVENGRLVLEADNDELDGLDLSRPDAVPLIVRLWARHDAMAAIQWVRSFPEGELKTESTRQIAVVLAETDPGAAVKWVETLELGPSREAALESLATRFASTSPDWALRFAGTMAPGVNRDQTMIHAFSQWASQAPAEAAEQARGLEDVNLRSNALAAVATAWADQHPSAAARIVADEIDDRAAQARTAISVIQRWAQTDPASTAAWVAGFEPDAFADTAVEQLLTTWSRRDPAAAGQWVGTMENATRRDAGYATLARHLSASDPGRAAQFAALIADPSRRQSSLAVLQNR